jgi:probable HAF family extracellular repeat protein
MRVLNLLLAALSSTSLWAVPSYQIFGLGNLGGPATAYAINNNGVIVGTSANAQGDYRGFVWNGGALIELAGLPGGLQQYANGINNAGTIAGSSDGTAVQWQNGSPTAVGAGPGNAMAINASGQVAGMQNGQAFRTVGGQVEFLGTLAGGNWASAYGINTAGDVAGYGDTASGNMNGFVSSNGKLQQIGTLGGNSSYAMAINDARQVVGHATRADGHLEAFLYYNGSLTGLGTLGGVASMAYGLNQSGAVVGSSWTAGDATMAAFLYANGQMKNLNDLVAPNSGWHLLAAHGINDRGQIVGTGLYNGEQFAVLLNPIAPTPLVSGFEPAALNAVPEPGTIGFIAAGLAFLAFGRWRRPSPESQE